MDWLVVSYHIIQLFFATTSITGRIGGCKVDDKDGGGERSVYISYFSPDIFSSNCYWLHIARCVGGWIFGG